MVVTLLDDLLKEWILKFLNVIRLVQVFSVLLSYSGEIVKAKWMKYSQMLAFEGLIFFFPTAIFFREDEGLGVTLSQFLKLSS